MNSAEDSRGDGPLVVICRDCTVDSAAEDTIRSAGYEVTWVEGVDELNELGQEGQEQQTAWVVQLGTEVEVGEVLQQAQEKVPGANILVLTRDGVEYSDESLHMGRGTDRVLWIGGFTESEQSLQGIRRFVSGEGYLWASDVLPADGRAIFLLESAGQSGQARYSRAEKLREVVEYLAGFTELEPMLQEALLKAMELLRCEAGSIYLWDESSEALVLRAAEGPQQDQRLGLRQNLGEGLAGWVAEAGEPILVTDVRKLDRLSGRSFERYPNHSCVSTPLMHGDRLLGVLCLTMPEEGYPFRPGDLLLAREMAAELGSLMSPLSVLAELRRLSEKLAGLFRQSSDLLVQKDGQVAEAYALSTEILEGVPIGVIAYDEQLRTRFSNAAAEGLFRLKGRPRSGVPLERGLDMEPDRWRKRLRGVIEEGEEFRLQRLIHRSPEKKLVLDVHGSPLHDPTGKCVGGILTVQDVTDDVEMEEKLMAAERLAVVGKVAAKVAHELNNPLDGILRFLNLAIRKLESEPERVEHYLRECRQGLLRMSNTLTQLLAFSRSRREDESVSVSQTVRDCIGLYEERIRSSDVEIELAVPADLPPSPVPELFEIVSNVVKNALDAMDKGGTLSVEAAREPEDAVVRILISDTGPGVDEDLSDKIFEPFFSTKTNGTNVGLGLAMCRDTLRKMGGDIRLLPYEKGARFEICAPVGDRQENIWVNRQEYSS